jgi:hypothetical protein
MTPAERKALDDYVAAVRGHYGGRLVDILIFGSRGRMNDLLERRARKNQKCRRARTRDNAHG